MVKYIAALLLLVPAAAAWAGDPPDPVTVSVTVLRATVEDREEAHFAQGTEAVRNAVSHLQYDTYRLIRSSQTRAPFEEEARLPIDSEYTLYVTPISAEANGRIRIETRVEQLVEDSAGNRRRVNALKTTSAVVPGDRLCFGGFSLDTGDMVIVLSVERR